MPFQTTFRRARFNAVGVTPQQMAQVGQDVIKSIQARLDRAQDVYDQSTPPLSARYSKFKEGRFGVNPIRDLRLTGRTRRAVNVLSAGQNYCVLGFSDAEALRRIRINQTRSRQWGMSPQNSRDALTALHRVLLKPVEVIQTQVA